MIAKSAFDVLQRIGLPEKADRGHFDLGLQLTCGASTCEAEMPARIVIFHGLSSGFPNHLESHACGSGNGLQSRPARLVDHWHVLHFERECAPIWTDGEAMLRDRHDPIESRWRNRRMTMVYLIARTAGPLNNVRHMCVKVPCCGARAAQYPPCITP